MKKYMLFGWLLCLVSSHSWASADYVVLHNHTGKRAVLTYQVDGKALQLQASPGMSVSNMDAAARYRMISLTLDGKPVTACEGIRFNYVYNGINLIVSGFKQITCQAVVHGKY